MRLADIELGEEEIDSVRFFIRWILPAINIAIGGGLLTGIFVVICLIIGLL